MALGTNLRHSVLLYCFCQPIPAILSTWIRTVINIYWLSVDNLFVWIIKAVKRFNQPGIWIKALHVSGLICFKKT